MDDVVRAYSKRIGARPYALKFESFTRILAEYFSDPRTCLLNRETGFPFCMWKKYCSLADEFVNFFCNQVALEVCEEEAMVLVNAFIGEGQCDWICFMLKYFFTICKSHVQAESE